MTNTDIKGRALELRNKMRDRAIAPDAKTPDWYSISNADGSDGDTAEIRIYEVIDSWGGWWGLSAKEFTDELDEITASKIVVAINSLGGEVLDGIAIYNALRLHPAHVTTRVDSMAASIASIIAQAGDVRQMVTGSQMMIHKAWGIAFGNGDEMRDSAAILDQQDGILAGIYAENTGGTKEHFAGLMDAETWMTADEAVAEGLADEVITPVPHSDSAANNKATNKFTEQAAAAVAEVEALVTRNLEVIAFRSDQGKPPLSEDSIELFDQLKDAVNRLETTVTDSDPDQDEIDAAWLDSIFQSLGVST